MRASDEPRLTKRPPGERAHRSVGRGSGPAVEDLRLLTGLHGLRTGTTAAAASKTIKLPVWARKPWTWARVWGSLSTWGESGGWARLSWPVSLTYSIPL